MKPEIVTDLTRESAARSFRALGLLPGDTVLVQSGFRNFRMIQGGPRALIEALLLAVGSQGTLIMPAFNVSDFGENKFYSKKNTKPQTGLLTELFFDREGCEHIYHPLHAFSLVGRRAGELAKKIRNQSSFGEDSLFGEIHRMNAKLMLLGISYRDGLTFLHYVEEVVGVPYRKFLDLTGKIEELDGTIHDVTIPYYGRTKMDLLYDFDNAAPFLEEGENPLVKKCVIGQGVVRLMEARPVYDRLAQALRENPNLVLVDQN